MHQIYIYICLSVCELKTRLSHIMYCMHLCFICPQGCSEDRVYVLQIANAVAAGDGLTDQDYRVKFVGELEPHVLSEAVSKKGARHLNQLRQCEMRIIMDVAPGVRSLEDGAMMTWEEFQIAFPLPTATLADKQNRMR